MANTFAPFGFRPTRLRGGSEPNYAVTQTKPILYTNSNKIYTGDPVQIDTSGYIDTLSPGTSIYYGIFLGCEYTSVSGGTVRAAYWPGSGVAVSGSAVAFLNTDPNQLFEVQVGGSTTDGVTFAAIEQNVQFAYGTGSQTVGGLSGAYIDRGTAPGTTDTLPFRVTNLSLRPNNDNTLPYNIIEVRFNYFLSTTTTGRS